MVLGMLKTFLSPPFMGGEEQKFIREAFESNWIAPLGPNEQMLIVKNIISTAKLLGIAS